MNRRSFLQASSIGLTTAVPSLAAFSQSTLGKKKNVAKSAPSQKTADLDSPERILLKDYRPKSIYKIPASEVPKAKFPIIDVHSHPYAKTPEQVDEWIRNMDEVGVEKTIVLTMSTGAEFNKITRDYSKYPERFELWCGFDLGRYDQPGFGAAAVRELERCHQSGARGVGEIHDKGRSLVSGKSKTLGMHPDDPRMDPLFDKCGELGLPVNLHVADPIWMYQKMDKYNDGLMNAYSWRLDNQPDIVDLPGMIEILERTVRKHPRTTFIACHFANLDYNLGHLGEVLDRNSNLYADISARYAETAPIPRFASQFFDKYADRLLYGTDMGYDKAMYRITFRILETLDEHFYEFDQFGYHWALNGFGLSDATLQSLYHDNAAKLLAARR